MIFLDVKRLRKCEFYEDSNGVSIAMRGFLIR